MCELAVSPPTLSACGLTNGLVYLPQQSSPARLIHLNLLQVLLLPLVL